MVKRLISVDYFQYDRDFQMNSMEERAFQLDITLTIHRLRFERNFFD